jgi:hypothetical protein
LATQQQHRTRPNCNAYSASADSSTRVRTLESGDSLEALIEVALRRWPNHRKDDWQLDLYCGALSDLVDECGLVRLKAAFRAASTRCHFLPEPPELRELLPPIPEHAKLKLAEHDPNCRNCDGSGWKNVLCPDRRVTRCHCKAPAVATATKPAFTPNLAPLHAFLKDAVERTKTMDPVPDPKRHVELKERIARDVADKEARRQRTKQDAAIREVLPSLPTETAEGNA